MRIPPMYVCPDCEGHGTFMYAGKIILKRCSECEDGRKHALTGSDRRKAMEVSPEIRRIFGTGNRYSQRNDEQISSGLNPRRSRLVWGQFDPTRF